MGAIGEPHQEKASQQQKTELSLAVVTFKNSEKVDRDQDFLNLIESYRADGEASKNYLILDDILLGNDSKTRDTDGLNA